MVTIAGVIGLTYVVTEVNQIPEGEGREKVGTLLELRSPLIIAVGVLLGVGVYCIAAARRSTTELP